MMKNMQVKKVNLIYGDSEKKWKRVNNIIYKLLQTNALNTEMIVKNGHNMAS